MEKLNQQIVTLSSAGSGKGGNEHVIALLRQENERLNLEITNLKNQLATSSSSAQLRELEIKLKTANSRIEELESQVRNYELQLRQFKDSKSSAASSVTDGQSSSRIQMTESQYSSSSTSSNKYISGGSTYQTPTYGQSSYTLGGTSGALTGSGVKDVSSTSYGTTGTTLYGVTGATSYGTTGGLSGSKVQLGQTTTSTYERKSGLSGSGISGSGYSYQTKKY